MICDCEGCGQPATHRSAIGRVYCAEHSEGASIPAYPIQPERPDPSGLGLVLRAIRHQFRPGVVGKAVCGRFEVAWRLSAETLEHLGMFIFGVPCIAVALVLIVLVFPWQLGQAIWLACRKPNDVRRAFRILDGLPVPPFRRRAAR